MRPLVPLVPLALAALVALPARSAWPSTAGGRIDKVVAGRDRLYALGGGGVETFDGEGRPLGGCARLAAPPSRAERRAPGAPDADEALAAAGFADDDDGTDAEDVLEDEGIGGHARRRPAAGEIVEVRDLAASPRAPEVWIATSAGLYRGSDGGCAPAALAGRDLLLVAEAGTAVAAASEDLLWWLDGASPGSVLAGLDRRPRALAIDGGPRIIVGDDEGIVAIDAGGGTTRLLDQPVAAIAACDGVVLALASDGAYAWSTDGAPQRVADRPPARRLACGPGGAARFVATGVGVWTSPDGAAWTEREETLGRSVASAAATDRIWVALDGDLVALEEIESPGSVTAATPSGGLESPPLSTLAPLAFPWPRLTIAFGGHEIFAATAQQASRRDGWSIVVLVAIPLERAAGRGAGARGVAALAAERLERDAALAAEAERLSSLPAGDERAARLSALDQERRALR